MHFVVGVALSSSPVPSPPRARDRLVDLLIRLRMSSARDCRGICRRTGSSVSIGGRGWWRLWTPRFYPTARRFDRFSSRAHFGVIKLNRVQFVVADLRCWFRLNRKRCSSRIAMLASSLDWTCPKEKVTSEASARVEHVRSRRASCAEPCWPTSAPILSQRKQPVHIVASLGCDTCSSRSAD